MKNKINYAGVILAIVIAVSVFLPWVASSFGGMEGESVKGFEFDDVKITPILAFIGAVVAFFRIRWAVILVGLICFLQGLLHLGWYLLADKISSNYSNGSSNLNPSFGLFIFLIASFAFMFSVKKLKKNEATLIR